MLCPLSSWYFNQARHTIEVKLSRCSWHYPTPSCSYFHPSRLPKARLVAWACHLVADPGFPPSEPKAKSFPRVALASYPLSSLPDSSHALRSALFMQGWRPDLTDYEYPLGSPGMIKLLRLFRPSRPLKFLAVYFRFNHPRRSVMVVAVVAHAYFAILCFDLIQLLSLARHSSSSLAACKQGSSLNFCSNYVSGRAGKIRSCRWILF